MVQALCRDEMQRLIPGGGMGHGFEGQRDAGKGESEEIMYGCGSDSSMAVLEILH